jgi:hypothetical protein
VRVRPDAGLEPSLSQTYNRARTITAGGFP